MQAMAEVSARTGYAGSSVRDVIAEAGIARSTFYAHFRDRDDCFLAALDFAAESVVTVVLEAARRGEKAAAVRRLVEFAQREPAAAKLIFVESLAGGQSALDRREGLRSRIEEAMAQSEPSQLLGGVFRLLAMRLSQSDPNLPELGDELTTWFGSYVEGDLSSLRKANSPGEIQAGPLPTLETPLAQQGGRHRLSPAELARNQRLRILRATASCSYQGSYGAMRVADITNAAQVSRKAFYQQFKGKAEAATEANEALFQAALSACAGSFFGAGSWPDRVWAGGSALLSFLAAHPRDAHLGFVETHAIGPEAARHVYDRLQAFTLFLEEGFRHRPEAEGLPRSISETLAAAMFELAFRELRERGDLEQLLQSLPLLTYTILAPFMGAEAASAFVATKTG